MNKNISDEQVFDIISSSFIKRFIAWIIDELVIGAIIILLFYVFGTLPSELASFPTSFLEDFTQITVLANLAYFTALEGYMGQSIGKFLLGIIVYEEEGARVSFTSALFRRIGLVIPIFSLIDGGAILLTSKDQRIFDIIAGTLVLDKDRREIASKFLRGRDVTDLLVSEGVSRGTPVREEENERKMLERLKEERKELKTKFENDELSETQYKKLERKYSSRINNLEKKIKNKKRE